MENNTLLLLMSIVGGLITSFIFYIIHWVFGTRPSVHFMLIATVLYIVVIGLLLFIKDFMAD